MNFQFGHAGTEKGRASNNFDFLRVAAAFFVIFGHQYEIFKFPPPALLTSSIATVGVKIFFAISGYLIAQSWDRDPHLIRFVLRRALRILPGLVVLCLFTAYVLGPIFTNLPLKSYLLDPRTFHYVWSNSKLSITYFLPGLFEANPIKYAVNGSLWSIPSEVFMYTIVAATGLCLWALRGKLNSLATWTVLLIIAVGIKVYFTFFYSGPMIVFYATSVNATFDVGVYFIAGAFLWQLSAFHKPRLDVAIIGLFALFILVGSAPTVFFYVEGLIFAYAVLALGLASTPIIDQTGRYGDFSYGLYLYAFPMQQISYQLFGTDYGWAIPFLFVVATTGALAYLSWHLIEKNALRFKPGKMGQRRAEAHAHLQPSATSEAPQPVLAEGAR